MSTPGLQLPHLTPSQSNKSVSVNVIADGVDGALTQQSIIDLSGGLDVTPSPTAVTPYMVLQLTGILTANIHLILPAYGHLFLIKNAIPYRAWVPGATHVVNDEIIDPSGHIQKVTSVSGSPPGVSGTSFPSWNDSGGTTTDGGVTWTDQGAATSYTVTVKSGAAWVASTAQTVNAQIVDGNGHVQQVYSVISVAKTGSSTPTFSTSGGLTTDNHVTWWDRGLATTVALSPGDTKFVYCDGTNCWKPN